VHVDALQQAGVSIIALCDRDQQRAGELALRAEAAHVFTEPDALFRETKPDTVHILTPPSSHASLALQAAEAGVHIVVEKPIALSLGEADEMIEAARRHGVSLIPHHNYLYKPSILHARELIESGEIGEVVHVESFYGLSNEGGSYGSGTGAHWAYRLPGGVFTNFLPHLIYLQGAFLGPIEAVTGVAIAPANLSTGAATELTVLVHGPNATGTMSVSMRAQPYAKYVRIFGTKGLVDADLVSELTTLHRLRRLPRLVNKALFNLEVLPQVVMGTITNSAKVATGAMQNMPEVETFVREVYESLAEGRDPPVSGEDGRVVVAIMEQVWDRLPAEALQQKASPSPSRFLPRTAVEKRIAESKALTGRVLVTGATGYLGRHVTAALVRCRADVRVFVRDPSRLPADLESRVEVWRGNVADADSLQGAIAGSDFVVHCAAVTTNKAPWRVHEQTNVEGTRAVVDAAGDAGVRRLVHVSSVIVYGFRGSTRQPLSESTPLPTAANHWAYYLRSKLLSEQAVRNADHGDMEFVVVRPGIIYGPGSAPASGLAQLGSARITIGRGTNHLPFTYIDNVVDGILLALLVPEAAGQVYNLVDAPEITARSVAERSAEILGESLRFLPIPPAVLNAAALIVEAKQRRSGADGPPRLSRFQVASATRDIRYDVTKARRELGWTGEVEIEEGLRRSLLG